MAIHFCAVPLKLRKTCPGMEIRIAVSKNITKGYTVVTLFYKINNDIPVKKKINNDISIFDKNYEKYTNKQKHHNYLDGN